MGDEMPSVTFRLPQPMREELEQLVDEGVFKDISEAVRHAVRNLIDLQPDQEVRPDGGAVQTASRQPVASKQSDRWEQRARGNVDRWGVQDVDVLLLALQEELGELTQAYLEAKHEGEPVERIRQELDDLAPLCYQLELAVRRGNGL